MLNRLPPLTHCGSRGRRAPSSRSMEAAHELSITQPAVSHQSKKPREYRGRVELFRRAWARGGTHGGGRRRLPSCREGFESLAASVELIASARRDRASEHTPRRPCSQRALAFPRLADFAKPSPRIDRASSPRAMVDAVARLDSAALVGNLDLMERRLRRWNPPRAPGNYPGSRADHLSAVANQLGSRARSWRQPSRPCSSRSPPTWRTTWLLHRRRRWTRHAHGDAWQSG